MCIYIKHYVHYTVIDQGVIQAPWTAHNASTNVHLPIWGSIWESKCAQRNRIPNGRGALFGGAFSVVQGVYSIMTKKY